MAIDTIIQKITKDEKATVITMLFTDNSKIKHLEDLREERFSLENFKARVRSIRDSFIQLDDPDVKLAVGPFDPSPEDPPPPTQEELAKSAYFALLVKCVQFKNAVTLGAKQMSDPDVAKAFADLKSGYTDELLVLFNRIVV